MSETFLMTNMTPQYGDLNRGPWQKLEGYLRTLVTRGNDVYIYAGVYGEKGKIKKEISIPTNSWKIAVAVPAGAPVSSVNENTRVIAVDMPNVKGIRNADWQIYRTTVRRSNKIRVTIFCRICRKICRTLWKQKLIRSTIETRAKNSRKITHYETNIFYIYPESFGFSNGDGAKRND